MGGEEEMMRWAKEDGVRLGVTVGRIRARARGHAWRTLEGNPLWVVSEELLSDLESSVVNAIIEWRVWREGGVVVLSDC